MKRLSLTRLKLALKNAAALVVQGPSSPQGDFYSVRDARRSQLIWELCGVLDLRIERCRYGRRHIICKGEYSSTRAHYYT